MNNPSIVIRASVVESEDYFLIADRRNPKKPKQLVIVLVAFLVVLLLSANDARRDYAEGKDHWWLPLVVLPPVCALLCLWMGPLGHRFRMRKEIRALVSHPPTEAHFEFSESGFLSTGKDGRSSFHPWATVPEAHLYPDGFAPVIDANVNVYFWIPQGSFATQGNYDEVVAVISSKVKKIQHHQA